jgi:uncharacterized protein (TIGR02996 family)
MRAFVYSDGKSSKFWNIDLQGTRFYTSFGKAGSKGQTRLKDFASEAEARTAHDRAIAEKLAEGYVETTEVKPAAPAAPTPLGRSMEAALAESPDDLATHSAYADYLMEQGDPLGEFIQVQLALEDESRPATERKKLREREAALLNKHSKRWLGDVGRFLHGDWSGPGKPWEYRFHRGWLDFVRVLPFPDAAVVALALSPEARLLRQLEVVYDMRYHPFDFEPFLVGPRAALADDEEENETYDGATILPPLFASSHITNLRSFKIGFSDDFQDNLRHSTCILVFEDSHALQVIELLKRNPHMEELYLNTGLGDVSPIFKLPQIQNLRVLQYYFWCNYMGDEDAGYPLRALADSTSLRRLEVLRLHPGRDEIIDIEDLDALLRSPSLPALTHLQAHMTNFDDEDYQRITDSGILRRLKVLDLGYGNMTDAGARILAASPDLRNLETLLVSRNALTARGLAALRATGVNVVADDQHGDGDTDYLDVDAE